MWSVAHRWSVLALWFVVTIGLFVASILAGGTTAQNALATQDGPRFESGKAYEVFNASGRDDPSESLVVVVSTATGTFDDPALAEQITDILAGMIALRSTVDGATVPTFDQVVDPLTAPPQAQLVSPDRTTVRIAARVPGVRAALVKRLEPVPGFIRDMRTSHPILAIHALNNTLANNDISRLVNEDLDSSLRITIPLTFAILLMAFGAVIAAVVPLVLAVTALLAAFGILGLYSQFVAPVSPYAGQLVVLIGLAVAVDYCLFMVTRFRTERRKRDKLAAIRVASSTAGRAVFFSGLVVMISIAGLFLLDDPLFRSMAVGTVSVVLISVVGSLTFLPAVLTILGDNVNRFRLPIIGRDRPEGSGPWSRIVRTTMHRPLLSFAVSAGILLTMASPVLRLHIGQSDFSSFPDSIDGVQALNLMNEKWPSGSTLQLQVVVTKANEPPTQAAIGEMSKRMLALKGVSPPVETKLSRDGNVALVSYVLAGGQNDAMNQSIVRDVRTQIVPAVFGALPGVDAYVTGGPAFTYDVAGVRSPLKPRRAWDLSVAALELAHEVDQGVHAGLGEGVVDRGTHPADRTMPLEPVEPGRRGLLDERRFEVLAGQPERDVHEAAAVRLGGWSPEAGPVDLRVELAGLAFVDRRDGRKTAEIQQPLEHQPQHVDAERRRGVVKRTVLGVDGVVQHRVQRLGRSRQQILADDDQDDAGRPQVLLGPAVDEAVLRDIDRPAEDVG